ncbi:TetR/AcrR family transcriptional regulator [Mycolicibacterium sediminis]|uniref:Transcriptional regulator n=1 Tax=Mycolicibacterium sediminis TaxID=1286180 RepID=A0A7I7QMU7_9MYCO|nr:helix-turn-helix domain-containing protein [Mycolicibacterium sediminis]BBY27297.1 transcriptional regulator [Mycolicibacterium sediminis]
MGGTISRESYLDTGLDVLSDQGYGGLKLAEVCSRLGVTTGSFYHYFSSWSVYGEELVTRWARSASVASEVRAEPDPRRRIKVLIQGALRISYGAEAGIRVWSSMDAAVHATQVGVDKQRYDVLFESALEVVGDEVEAERFATSAMYLLIGCEQSTLPRATEILQWMAGRLIAAMETGNFGHELDLT